LSAATLSIGRLGLFDPDNLVALTFQTRRSAVGPEDFDHLGLLLSTETGMLPPLVTRD
jgi:hypothetical protein